MKAPVTFECTRCGKCCETIVGPMMGLLHGLTILPEERKLFPPETIEPMMRFSLRAVYAPGHIIMYQVSVSPCPWYDVEGKECDIYLDRPLICRAFPFEVVHNQGITPHASCPEIARLKEQKATMKIFKSYIDPGKVIANYYLAQTANSPDIKHLQRYCLRTKVWKRVDYGVT